MNYSDAKYKQRKRNRLKNYDYSQDGWYFVTICVKNKKTLFGEIKNGEMTLNGYGKIVRNHWLDLPNHYVNCQLDEFIVMPNHVHGIVIIDDQTVVGNGFKPFPTTNPFPTKKHGLSEIIRGFKTFSSRRINEYFGDGLFRWQKSFYDHIIRNEISLENIRKYIINNPLKWALDKNNPEIS